MGACNRFRSNVLRWKEAPIQGQESARMKSSLKPHILSILALGIFCILAAGSMDDNSSAPNPTSSSEPASVPDGPEVLNNAKALDDKYGIAAAIECASGADDYLRSIAKYDFKWDDMGMLDTKFDHYLKAVPSPGVLTSTSDKAKLQNGFGAYTHIELFCNYDTQSHKVLKYWIREDAYE
jgi:hypothetical protein